MEFYPEPEDNDTYREYVFDLGDLISPQGAIDEPAITASYFEEDSGKLGTTSHEIITYSSARDIMDLLVLRIAEVGRNVVAEKGGSLPEHVGALRGEAEDTGALEEVELYWQPRGTSANSDPKGMITVISMEDMSVGTEYEITLHAGGGITIERFTRLFDHSHKEISWQPEHEPAFDYDTASQQADLLYAGREVTRKLGLTTVTEAEAQDLIRRLALYGAEPEVTELD